MVVEFEETRFVSGHGLWPCRLNRKERIARPQGATIQNLQAIGHYAYGRVKRLTQENGRAEPLP
jgi:hypothetical protein